MTMEAIDAVETAPEAGGPTSFFARSRRAVAVGAVALVAAIGGGRYWMYASAHESTDDAQVDAEIVAVPAKLGATVNKLHFVDNQSVKAGELLAELDDAAPRARLAQAQANVDAAEAASEAADADAHAAENNATGGKAIADASLTTAHVAATTAREQLVEAAASIRSAGAALDQAQLDRDRAASLYADRAIPKSQLDQAETALALATASYEGARAPRGDAAHERGPGLEPHRRGLGARDASGRRRHRRAASAGSRQVRPRPGRDREGRARSRRARPVYTRIVAPARRRRLQEEHRRGPERARRPDDRRSS